MALLPGGLTMINISDARDSLTKIISEAVGDTVKVYRSAIDGVATFPAVVLGMPAWDEEPATTYCFPRWTWPVGVVVARPGGNDELTVDQLDQLWPVVFYQLRDTSLSDPGLGGVCAQSVINRAAFGQFPIQGQNYPAQLITLEMYG